MYLASTLALIAALASSAVVRADVVPSEPSPNSIYREGQTCPIVWEADTSSPSPWKNMNIELMTGDNFNMIHVTTVTTGQDGTINGRFEYPCPDVTVNSNIYFYQFTSPQASNKTWTTRFTIADATGETTPPANPTQPGSNDPIPWGVGALADPSKAVAPPAGGGGGGTLGASGSISASGPVLAATSSTPLLATSAPLSTSPLATLSSTRLVTSSSSSAISSGASAKSTGAASNSATGVSATSTMSSLLLFAFTFVLFL